jgi:hypothetical protein
MTALQITENAKQTFENLALSYSNNGEIQEAIKVASTFLKTNADTSDFELVLKLFLEGKISATVNKTSADGTIITENIIYERKRQWGGSRTGSGRKKKAKTKIVSFRVNEDFVDKLKEVVNKAIDSWK